MELLKIIEDMKKEREGITEAIMVLERLAASKGGARRGRPPAWMSAMRDKVKGKGKAKKIEAIANGSEKTGRTFTRAQKKAQSERMKKNWAAKRKAAKATATAASAPEKSTAA